MKHHTEHKHQTTQKQIADTAHNGKGMTLPAVSVLQQKEVEAPVLEFSDQIQLRDTGSGMPVQLKAQEVRVSGLTHLVGIRGNSLFHGPEDAEVVAGTKLTIDPDDPFWSRRGPNQEIPENRAMDEAGDTKYAWYPLHSKNSSDYSKDGWKHLRDETFDIINESDSSLTPASDRGDHERRLRADMIERNVDGWKLSIPYATFEEDAMTIFAYIKLKGLQGSLAGKRILITKAPGKAGAVCHHWSFGGLNPGFTMEISEIHGRLGGTQAFKSDEDNDLPDEFREKVLGWSGINPDGLTPDGSLAHLRVYGGNEHSSRLVNGNYFHKFGPNNFVFAVEGGDINAAYSSMEEIAVKVYDASGLGESSYFSYEKE